MPRPIAKTHIHFLHGTYREAHLPFYKSLCRGKFKIAVDGGYAFFRRSGVRPDVLIGDFDSLKRIPAQLPRQTEVVRHPVNKNKTDGHLALDLSLKLGAKSIDIVMPSVGEIDHFLGSIMLLDLFKSARRKLALRVINYDLELRLLSDESLTVANARGDKLSLVPISARVRYSCSGTEYDVRNLSLRRGDSLALRNRIDSRRARIKVVGRAFLIRYFHK